jgi:integrase
MAYAEKRGNLWRARWRGPDGTLESRPGFHRRKAAENYGRDQEAAIRANTYVDPRAGKITLTEWVNQWYPALLGDAIPRYIQANAAQRRRGKGRKGQRRIQRIEQAGKAWATPIQALLVAERCAALSGYDTDFVMIVTVAYTGMRWSEVIGLGPECLHDGHVDVSWKLYELNGRFYRGRPKDGSIRPADLPPFLAGMLTNHVRVRARKCTCRNTEKPWCPGGRYVFLGPEQGHFRRSNYSERFFRPAADGTYPARGQRPAMPVLVDIETPYPGRPVPPWPMAMPGQEFQPPAGRGVARLVSDTATGRCAICGRAWPRRLDGRLISHSAGGSRCEGSGQPPAGDLTLASWLPVLPRLTPTACGTVTRRGWTKTASQTFSNLNGWATKSLACAASTATSVPPCGPSSRPHCKSAGRLHFVNAPG